MMRSVLLAAGVAVFAVLWIVSGELAKEEPEPKAPTEEAGKASQQRVRVATFRAQPVTDRITLAATTAPNRSARVTAETGGPIAEVAVEKGARVAAGDLLVRLEMQDRDARLAQAKAKVAEAKEAVAAQKVNFEAAQRLRDQGHRAKVEFAQARAELERARAGLEAAKSGLAQIREEIEHTRITAPFGGVVDELPVEAGENVSPGKMVAKLLDMRPLRVEGYLAENQANAVQTGDPAKVQLDGSGTRRGDIAYLATQAGAQTRTLAVEAVVPNQSGQPVPAGISATLRLPLGERPAHRIPRSSLVLSKEGQVGVRTVDDSDTVRFHAVETLRDAEEGLWVTGLPKTARVITVGQGFVTAGQAVQTSRDKRYSDGGGEVS